VTGDERVQQILDRALADVAGARSTSDLEQIRVRVLGRSGELTALLRSLGSIPAADRPRVGAEANAAKAQLEEQIAARLEALKAQEHQQALAAERPDLTLPGRRAPAGAVHPVTRVQNEIIEIFEGLGFSVAEGPEVESDYYNFAALNFPDDHPARDMQDTFHLSQDTLLRTHTSPVQIRTMKAQRPPVRFIFPGKVYRRDADITHSPMFHQVEGLAVDRHITMADLKATLELFAREMFGPRSRLRFRPSFFPFTEPSAEADVVCFLCSGTGCRVCKQSGWLEILGSGMVHPNVLRNVGYDPEEVTGWAFGMGVERIAMLKYGIDDIRLLFENDLRFLEQFGPSASALPGEGNGGSLSAGRGEGRVRGK
jgi:phenylalanyl-tRNA synthetase alpha chain